jgi:hypothetical protein
MPGHVVPRDASVATGPLEIKDHSLQGLVHQIGFVPDQMILRAGGSELAPVNSDANPCRVIRYWGQLTLGGRP